VNNTEIAEYLEGGAAALASGELRWVQGSFGNTYHMTACALGACNYARYGGVCLMNRRDSGIIRQASQKLVGMVLEQYNDTPGRTVNEVVDTLINLAKDFRNA
jgi:hypothetical protein